MDSYLFDSMKNVLRFFFALMIMSVVTVSLVRTVTIINKLPSLFSDSFKGVAITNGKLTAPKNNYPIREWAIAEMITTVTGRTVDPDLIPDSSLMVLPTNDQGIVKLKQDSIVIDYKVNNKQIYFWGASWKSIFGDKIVNIDKKAIKNFFLKGSISMFVGVFLGVLLSTIQDLLVYILMLSFIIFFYSRELRKFWRKGTITKIMVNSLVPYFILLPIFAIAGADIDFVVSISILVSSVILGRAFAYNRKWLKLDIVDE